MTKLDKLIKRMVRAGGRNRHNRRRLSKKRIKAGMRFLTATILF